MAQQYSNREAWSLNSSHLGKKVTRSSICETKTGTL